MTQGLYLIADPNADQKKLCEQFKQICLTQTPDALLFDPKGKNKEKIKSFLKTVPNRPGSYRMYDKNETVIYVGKAKDPLTILLPVILNTVSSPTFSFNHATCGSAL